MPHSIKVKTNHGSVKFRYVISTPGALSAKKIDTSLPTILLLHPVYISMDIFHPQFADPRIRRFNLVCVDLLGHGETEGKVPKGYGQKEAADDVVKFMDAVGIPSCYLVGLSMGTIIGIQLAITYPEKVLGLFLISPLGTEEPEDVAEGRREIHDCWVAGFNGKKIDEDALKDSVYGALQLGFNSETSKIVSALTAIMLPQGMKNWSPKHFDEFNTCTVKFFTERAGYSKEELAKLRNSPVVMIHCLADVAYSIEYMNVFVDQLKEAGVPVTVHELENAPHFGCVTHPNIVNTMLEDFVVTLHKAPLPQPPQEVTSPFEIALKKAGWTLSDDEDDYF